ncbi:hypothetical protein K438DRAFT_1959544 [Mycena galopus ATCC 62051]|nr:hypothetical protein K438DRAFT_1959544 [Mycena galopus ATCC 62051]
MSQILLEQLHAHHNKLFPCARNYHKPTNPTQILVDPFAAQMKAMTDQYMEWSVATAEGGFGKLYTQPEDAMVQDVHRIYVVDLFAASYTEALSPHLANVAVTIHTLEVFRVTQLCCPRLGVQPFVCALCHIHSVHPRPYLTVQFSVAFNVYFAIHAEVDKHGEQAVPLPFLATFDGNNSLKRFWHCEREVIRADSMSAPRGTKEQLDNRVAPGDYYLPRVEVDKWAKVSGEPPVRPSVRPSVRLRPIAPPHFLVRFFIQPRPSVRPPTTRPSVLCPSLRLRLERRPPSLQTPSSSDPPRPVALTGTCYAIKLETTADRSGHVLLASTYKNLT